MGGIDAGDVGDHAVAAVGLLVVAGELDVVASPNLGLDLGEHLGRRRAPEAGPPVAGLALGVGELDARAIDRLALMLGGRRRLCGLASCP